jgi:hypothetical protein
LCNKTLGIVKEANLDTEMQNTLTLRGFENPGLIATPTPTKGTRAPYPQTAYAARIHRQIENSWNGRDFGVFQSAPYYFFGENNKNRPLPPSVYLCRSMPTQGIRKL